MAEEETEDGAAPPDDGEDGEGQPGKGGKDGKKKLLLIVAAFLLLIMGALAAAYFTGLLQPLIDELLDGSEGADEMVMAKSGTFYELPEMIVNLNTSGRKSTFLKIKVSIELDNPETIPQIESVMPRVLDNFQVYLRELRIDDLRGSAGMYRLREELLLRVNTAVAPVQVRDVLFNEVLVQ
ncbi:MAG: flagellar basal body-associated FliL family protein [Rhodospirillales bacterium]